MVDSKSKISKNSSPNNQIRNLLREFQPLDKIIENTSISTNLTQEYLKNRKNVCDWLVLVVQKLNYMDITYFLTIAIIDKIALSLDYQMDNDDLFLISNTALLLASKFKEPKPLSIQTLLSKVNHNKHTKEDVVACEQLILQRLKFRMPRLEVNFVDQIYQLISSLEIELEFQNYLFDSAINIAKFLVCENNKFWENNSNIVAIVYTACYFASKIDNINNLYNIKKVEAKIVEFVNILKIDKAQIKVAFVAYKQALKALIENKELIPFLYENGIKKYIIGL